jgi:hypothetical protein
MRGFAALVKLRMGLRYNRERKQRGVLNENQLRIIWGERKYGLPAAARKREQLLEETNSIPSLTWT